MDRVPPHSVEAEAGLLGAVLGNNEQWLPELMPEVFYRTGHRVIWQAIRSLIGRGEAADIVTVAQELRSQGTSEKAGGAAYVASLTQAGVPGHAEEYARKIIELWKLRQSILKAYEIAEASYSMASLDDVAAMFAAGADAIPTKSPRMAHAKEVLRDVMQQLEDGYEGKAEAGLSTGYRDLDEYVRLIPSELVVLAGRPGMGKSAASIGTAAETVAAGVTTVVFSIEMSREAIIKRAISRVGGIRASRLRDPTQLQDSDWPKLQTAAGKLANAPLWIDDTAQISSAHVLSESRRIQRQHGLGLVVVDHLGRMWEPGFAPGYPMVSESARQLKNAAKTLGVPILLLAQLSREVEKRKPPKPILSDLRESGRVEEEADIVLMLYRPEYYLRKQTKPEEQGIGYVSIEKAREGKSGVDRKLAWDEEHVCYRDLEEYRR